MSLIKCGTNAFMFYKYKILYYVKKFKLPFLKP